MLPNIKIFCISLSTYGIFTSIGLILMGTVAYILSRKYRILIEDIVFGEITALAGAFIGAHLLYGITNAENIIRCFNIYITEKRNMEYLWNIFVSFFGGMVFYGGLIFGLLFGVLYCKIRKINVCEFGDCFAVGIPLFHSFGRIGCFLSGCCYGIESDLGFTATNAIVDSCNNVNRFPVQLLESGFNIVIFVLLLFLFQKGIMNGRLIFIYLIMYSITRFFVEFLRGDTFRGIWLGLSTSQWISIILFIISVFVVIKYKIKTRKF